MLPPGLKGSMLTHAKCPTWQTVYPPDRGAPLKRGWLLDQLCRPRASNLLAGAAEPKVAGEAGQQLFHTRFVLHRRRLNIFPAPKLSFRALAPTRLSCSRNLIFVDQLATLHSLHKHFRRVALGFLANGSPPHLSVL
jgi:hypothetical protein